MAVDSHEDNQYELAIDSVNNNLKKTLEPDFEDSECDLISLLPPYSPDSSQSSTCGSARRKYNSLSKGISIEEFLGGQEGGQLSAIDKLLMKNKAALENQMKQTRSKILKEIKPKKESKPRKEKVLGSKVATQKKTVQSEKKVKVKPKKNEVKKVTPKVPKGEQPKNVRKPKPKPVDGKVVKRSPKKPSEAKRKPKTDADGKPIVKIKKLSKNGRNTDLKSFKANASHKTRSFTKVKLRNGKSRILPENNKPNPTPTRKYVRRSIANGENSAEMVNGKTPLKRAIKQEPLEEDTTVWRKRRKTNKLNQTVDSLETNNVPNGNCTPKELKTVKHQTAVISQNTHIKEEFVKSFKQEVNQPENTIEEINVVNKDLIYRNTNEESNVSYVLQDLGSYVKEIERKTSKSDTPTSSAPEAKKEIQIIEDSNESEDTECEEFSLQDANTESEDIIDEDITLQYESDNDNDVCQQKDNHVQPLTNNEQSIDLVEKPTSGDIPIVESSSATVNEIPPASQVIEKAPAVEKLPENNAVKESILGALGLQSLEKVNQKAKDKERDNYTGTLKAVIKIDKGCRRMEMKQKESNSAEGVENVLSFYSKIIQNNVEDGTGTGVDKSSMENGTLNGDAFKSAKPHDDSLLNSIREASARPADSEYNAILDPANSQLAKDKTKAAASLVVPEKSSSFSIHPNRLCSDVCKYCFGKFGSLDTPCHVGQMKNPERQRKILLSEPNLKLDTCLCDACYRYVDRKANKPQQKRSKNMRRSMSINQRTVCVIQNCNQFARHTVKRKWLLRISKKIAKLSFDINKGGPRMRFGLCSQHYYLVDFYTLCGICKKRLNRNHMYSIRSELNDLNEILKEDSIPIKLVDNMLLCKLCHYYMSLRLKYGTSSKMSPSNRQYYQNFRKKILIYYNVMISDSEDTNSSECPPLENGNASTSERLRAQLADSDGKESTDNKRSSNAMKNHNVGIEDIANLLKPLEGDGDKNSARIQVKFGNLNIGKLSNLNIGQNTQTEVKHDKSNDKELPLIADFCFETPISGQTNWEKCVTTIQFDKGTKKLWQDLQKPYGNQSSFMRHLIMLEKYWRTGALVLSETADAGAVKYINSVNNRIESLETSTSKPSVQPTTSTPVFEKKEVRQTPAPPPLLKIDQLPLQFGVRKVSPESKPSVPVQCRSTDISLSQYTEMMHPQPRSKQLIHIDENFQTGVSSLKNTTSTPPMPSMKPVMRKSSETYPPKFFGFMQKTQQRNPSFEQMDKMRKSSTPLMKVSKEPSKYMPYLTPLTAINTTKIANDEPSLMIAKLPKALTVTQIDEPLKEKIEDKPQLIPSPFLAGEKPSISVFRELSK